VRLFVNTLEVEDGDDALASPSLLTGWLSEHGLVQDGVRATAAELRRVRALREALRVLLIANNGGTNIEVEPAMAVLDRQARDAGLAVRFAVESGGAVLAPSAAGVRGAIGRLLAIVAGAMADGTWPRLKACEAGTCLWAFYDHAKNRSRRWCSMAVCGNRTKVRAYRERGGTGA